MLTDADLDTPDLVSLQLLSKHFLTITRDNGLWKKLCLRDSQSEAVRRGRDLLFGTPILVQEARVFELQRVVAHSASSNGNTKTVSRDTVGIARAMACWDPSYKFEKVNWYNEYIARHAPLSMGWLQQPYSDAERFREKLEARGMGLWKDAEKNIVIAPLDDGSVCMWDLGEEDSPSHSKNGRIMACSRANLLSVDGPEGTNWQHPTGSRARMTSTGVVECVSVDKARNKAYFAVQSGLNEVDLNSLQISSYDRYPFPISALSEANHPISLTVGTTHSLHIHDPRIGHNGRRSSYTYFTSGVDIEQPATQPTTPNDFSRLLSGDTYSVIDYARLFQPLPLSILHLNASTIHVAGRFPSILHYDRRNFPRLASTIHSGGSLCSLTSLPTPKAPTLAACGEYNGKGSLELYPLAGPQTSLQPLPYRNRTSASSSKLLSLTAHGTRLLFSDSSGVLKWVERDGSTLVRRWNINPYTHSPDQINPANTAAVNPPALQAGLFNNEPNEGDVARKLLPVNAAKEKSEVLLWSGDRIGVVGCRAKPRFQFEGHEVGDDVSEMSGEGVEERKYAGMMRRALERQADEVRFIRGLGVRF